MRCGAAMVTKMVKKTPKKYWRDYTEKLDL